MVNLCIRCGKERKISKTWKEKVETYRGIVVLTHEEYVCPDPECQKLVNIELQDRKDRKAEMAQAAEDRKQRMKKGKK